MTKTMTWLGRSRQTALSKPRLAKKPGNRGDLARGNEVPCRRQDAPFSAHMNKNGMIPCPRGQRQPTKPDPCTDLKKRGDRSRKGACQRDKRAASCRPVLNLPRTTNGGNITETMRGRNLRISEQDEMAILFGQTDWICRRVTAHRCWQWTRGPHPSAPADS